VFGWPMQPALRYSQWNSIRPRRDSGFGLIAVASCIGLISRSPRRLHRQLRHSRRPRLGS